MRSVINIRCSTFACSTFNLFTIPARRFLLKRSSSGERASICHLKYFPLPHSRASRHPRFLTFDLWPWSFGLEPLTLSLFHINLKLWIYYNLTLILSMLYWKRDWKMAWNTTRQELFGYRPKTFRKNGPAKTSLPGITIRHFGRSRPFRLGEARSERFHWQSGQPRDYWWNSTAAVADRGGEICYR